MLIYFWTMFPGLSVFYALFLVTACAYAPVMVRRARRVPRHHAYRTPMPADWSAAALFA